MFAREFDAIGVVVDWIDACRQRRLLDLLELYDERAVIECCEGGRFEGLSEIETYWQQRLAASTEAGFEIDAIMPHAEVVQLDYRGCGGEPLRTYFRFSSGGKIRSTACELITAAA
jgi:hypothetical protein